MWDFILMNDGYGGVYYHIEWLCNHRQGHFNDTFCIYNEARKKYRWITLKDVEQYE